MKSRMQRIDQKRHRIFADAFTHDNGRLAQLTALRQLRELISQAELEAVTELRQPREATRYDHGTRHTAVHGFHNSWQSIADAMGLHSRQAAQQRFGTREHRAPSTGDDN